MTNLTSPRNLTTRNPLQDQWVNILLVLTLSILLSSCRSLPPAPNSSTPTSSSNTLRAPTQLPDTTPQQTPLNIDISNKSAGPKLDIKWYIHPKGYFELLAPSWIIKSGAYSTTFIDPTSKSTLTAEVTNTGHHLDRSSLERFIHARETNIFGAYGTYPEINQPVEDENGFLSVIKSQPSAIIKTSYHQFDQVVLVLELQTNTDDFALYKDCFSKVESSVVLNSEAATDIPAYAWETPYLYTNDFVSVELPNSWEFNHTAGEFTTVDTFYAPDGNAAVQTVTYDDGEPILKSEAGAFSLTLLNNYYAHDIHVTLDEVLKDGRECLSWFSKSGDYQGVSCFETRMTAFLLFTVMYQNSFGDVYEEILDNVSSSYTRISSEDTSKD